MRLVEITSIRLGLGILLLVAQCFANSQLSEAQKYLNEFEDINSEVSKLINQKDYGQLNALFLRLRETLYNFKLEEEFKLIGSQSKAAKSRDNIRRTVEQLEKLIVVSKILEAHSSDFYHESLNSSNTIFEEVFSLYQDEMNVLIEVTGR